MHQRPSNTPVSGIVMSCFKEDRATLNENATKLDADLTQSLLDAALQKAFEGGMELDEIMYVVTGHVERTVRRYIVQDQLKKVANKEKNS